MNWNAVMEAAWVLINSSFGFALAWCICLGVFTFLASRFNPFEEKWRAWEGSIITAIKLAEKQIPEGVPNPGLARLDAALRFVLKAYAEANGGRQAPPKLAEQLKQAIQIKHAELERLGNLEAGETR